MTQHRRPSAAARLPRALTALALLTCVSLPLGASADTLAVTGTLRTLQGAPAPDGAYGLQITLYAGDGAAKQLVHSEKFLGVQVIGGVFSLSLGADPQLPFDAVAAAGQASHLGVAVDGEPELPLVPLVPVLRAWRANLADDALQAQLAINALSATKADLATHATTADSAKNADVAGLAAQATLAIAALNADQAASADEATVANTAFSLQCTGCITAGHLTPPLAADLARRGAANTFAGQQTFSGGADFASKPVVGFRFENAASDPVVCDADQKGYAYYDTSDDSLKVCNGLKFQPFAKAVPLGSKNNPGTSCKAILDGGGSVGDGVYWVEFAAGNTTQAHPVRCDMTHDGGGWTLVLSNVRGGTNKPATDLKWDAAIHTPPLVPAGGSAEAQLAAALDDVVVYTGLSHWGQLSPGGTLRYDWSSNDGQPLQGRAVADYTLTGENYVITFSNKDLLIGDEPGLFSHHGGAPYSAVDKDNDQNPGQNCSASFSSTPWWYKKCWDGNVHGGGESTGEGYYNGAYWKGSAKAWGAADGTGAGNGWIWVR
jgi:hypothetical protein